VDILNPSPHYGFHTHKITADLLENNINEPKKVEVTSEYTLLLNKHWLIFVDM